MKFSVMEAQHIVEALKLHRERFIHGLNQTKSAMAHVKNRQSQLDLQGQRDQYNEVIKQVEDLLDKTVKWLNDNLDKATSQAMETKLANIGYGEDGDGHQTPVRLVEMTPELLEHANDQEEDDEVNREYTRGVPGHDQPPEEEDEDSDPDFWKDTDGEVDVGSRCEVDKELSEDDGPEEDGKQTLPVDPDPA